MNIYFGYDVQYPFKALRIEKDQIELYFLSLFVVVVYQILGQYISTLKVVAVQKETNILSQSLINLVLIAHRVFSMLILMTTNGGAVIAVIVGTILGFLIFNSKYVRKESHANLDNRACC